MVPPTPPAQFVAAPRRVALEEWGDTGRPLHQPVLASNRPKPKGEVRRTTEPGTIERA